MNSGFNIAHKSETDHRISVRVHTRSDNIARNSRWSSCRYVQWLFLLASVYTSHFPYKVLFSGQAFLSLQSGGLAAHTPVSQCISLLSWGRFWSTPCLAITKLVFSSLIGYLVSNLLPPRITRLTFLHDSFLLFTIRCGGWMGLVSECGAY